MVLLNEPENVLMDMKALSLLIIKVPIIPNPMSRFVKEQSKR
jgi:hypothetical protein